MKGGTDKRRESSVFSPFKVKETGKTFGEDVPSDDRVALVLAPDEG